MNSERFQRGAEISRQLDGGTGEIADMDSMDALGQLIHEFAMGDVYGRPGLPMRDRLLVTITTVTVLGVDKDLIKNHMVRALKNGVTKKELEEVLIQIAVYAGFPRAVLASQALKLIDE